MSRQYDIIIIGGGFFGINIALHFAAKKQKVLVIESHSQIMQEASYSNQARVHNGYHYPRSFLTAARSSINFARFCTEYSDAIFKDFTKLYAIPKNGSQTTAKQFYNLFEKLQAPIKIADKTHSDLFASELIEQVFEVTEHAFDSTILKKILEKQLRAASKFIDIDFNTTVSKVAYASGQISVFRDTELVATTPQVFNCTYAAINTLLIDSGLPIIPIKYELAEMAMIKPPAALKNIGVTVMDGPFFSTMPFPALDLHSLSHVRFTPRISWLDGGQPTDQTLADIKQDSHWQLMLQDAARYIPKLTHAEYKKSLYIIKTILLKNEVNDGRPILHKSDYHIPGFHLVLGGKIDNIYDILENL